MDLEQLLERITPEIYANLQRAIELGKWHDGRVLSKEERQLCLQAVIAYGEKNLVEEERAGFVDMTEEKKKKRDNKIEQLEKAGVQPLNFIGK
ncbi:hypothetical protein EDC56_1738 [Sinobacterium caligoides]|uniref:DUF1315 family protein n=1 Tax=Sinobacterium caligoides TaxID=933926 RepID=A0A3N2DNS1_9GAMM|nr:DUF1315 family protein [Sinobacterium caligoides]ROS01309.1 hypothetical protein EDC56_1738 [Sinobacterium caligoides]